MAQSIQTRYGSINFTNFENLADKEIFTSGNTQAYANSIFRDPSTGKIKTSNVITVNTTSEDKSDKLTTPALLLNWSGASLNINGKTYIINTTPELLEAIIAAAQTTTGNENLPIQASTALNELNALESRIYECEEKLGLSHG